MDATELQPVLEFLGRQVPFDALSREALALCCRSLVIGYYAKASGYVAMDASRPRLHLVRSGAFEVRTPEGELIDRLGEGDCFGFSSMLSGEEIVNRVVILEDGLVYHLDADTFDVLRRQSREFDRFFNRMFAQRLRNQGRYRAKELATSRICALMTATPMSIDGQASVTAAAQLMQQHRISSLLVTDGLALSGILTDRDLRNRVLAAGLDGGVAVHRVMTPRPVSLQANASVFEAMQLMSEHNIHHLPLLEQGRPVGIVTSTDLLRRQSCQPLLLIGEIERQTDLPGLVQVSKQLPLLLQNLIGADTRAEEVGRILTSVTDALTRRLLLLNQALLGEPPMAYCWLAFGSQGRQDQAACSDQDNGLLLAEEPDAEALGYFSALSRAVCEGLSLCGFPLCPGNIMAQNPDWCLSLTRWQQQFVQWVATPDPGALLHASIFFDMRPVFGPASLFAALQDKVLADTRKNALFLAALAGNALQTSAPLGFFRTWVLERDGREIKGIDLKHRGNALINDIARVYALAAGIKEVNTAQRIRAVMALGELNRQDALNLADAQEFIAHRRLANQGAQFTAGQPMSNYLKPADVSSLVRHQLRDAFRVVHEAQDGLRMTFLRRF
ncbi:DUF294 nucleotidyltransferase-like domain-containing protein [Shewanella sp. AS16]|uniref:DUF294 nucleotidyltransferase-like domain-containing protein n=1 Tax=Shewanella sp. AS16 TaxID=2907625 RepID=UPI001F37F5B0|nr:DUF294 nucleotidyltransferase-like domain-containing protein [Shewanella sp. AS16]MCE9686914.1 DUF294 nucleotidyltransferase-like domain-containing protein [Shewanella sp. AS16]